MVQCNAINVCGGMRGGLDLCWCACCVGSGMCLKMIE